MKRTPAAAEPPNIAGGLRSDFTRGVFWLLRAAARNASAAVTALALARAGTKCRRFPSKHITVPVSVLAGDDDAGLVGDGLKR
jgi:hypothetical protein